MAAALYPCHFFLRSLRPVFELNDEDTFLEWPFWAFDMVFNKFWGNSQVKFLYHFWAFLECRDVDLLGFGHAGGMPLIWLQF